MFRQNTYAGQCNVAELVKFSKKLETQWMKVSELSGRRLTLHSDCVPQIFSILEMRFATPEIIIDLLLKQIK